MIQAPSARGKARSFTFAVAVVTVVGVIAACADSPRANGQACIRDQDCLSGVCVQDTCAAAPLLLDAEVEDDGSLDGTTGGDTAVESSVDSGTPAAETGAGDTGSASPDSGAASDTGTAAETGSE
jgi:hypothetical protein